MDLKYNSKSIQNIDEEGKNETVTLKMTYG